MGICIGGHLAFRASMNPDVLGGVCFYATDIHKGSLGLGGDDSLARASEIKGEMLMIWGRQDPHVPADGRARIHLRMAEAGVRFTWHEFNGQHAFLRDEGPRYDPALALACYRMVVDFFQRKLGEGDVTECAHGQGWRNTPLGFRRREEKAGGVFRSRPSGGKEAEADAASAMGSDERRQPSQLPKLGTVTCACFSFTSLFDVSKDL